MADPLRLRVMTPSETLLDVEEVTHIRLFLSDGGSIGLKPGHASLMAETISGSLAYMIGEREYQFPAQAGILFIERETVTIFTSGSGEFKIPDLTHNGNDRLAGTVLNQIEFRPSHESSNDG